MDKANKIDTESRAYSQVQLSLSLKQKTHLFRVSVVRSGTSWEGAAVYKEKLYLLLEKLQRFRKSNQCSPFCFSDSSSLV